MPDIRDLDVALEEAKKKRAEINASIYQLDINELNTAMFDLLIAIGDAVLRIRVRT